MNGLIAADSVVVPQTMKGFDLATLATYVTNIEEYLEFILSFEPDIEIGIGAHCGAGDHCAGAERARHRADP